jgi:serine/threonine protein kinase
MATLMPPFTGKDFPSLYRKIKSGVYAPISSTKYSKELAAFLKKMIVLNPKQRLTASELLKITKFSSLK